MSLLTKLANKKAYTDYYDESFKNTLEAHLPTLRNSAKTRTVVISPLQSVVYKGNLYGLLNELRVPSFQHWIVMRLNAMFSSFELDDSISTLLLPDMAELEQLRLSWKASQKVNA